MMPPVWKESTRDGMNLSARSYTLKVCARCGVERVYEGWCPECDSEQETRVIKVVPAPTQGAVSADDPGWALNDAIIDALRSTVDNPDRDRLWNAVGAFQASATPRGAVQVADEMIERGARALWHATPRHGDETYAQWARAVPVFAELGRRQAAAVLRAALEVTDA